MKKLLLLALFFVGFYACESPEQLMDDGVIIGYDIRFCPCCGGVYIEIQNDTFRFYELPDTSFQFTSSDLPLDVSLDWSPQANQCLSDEIDIHKIVKK